MSTYLQMGHDSENLVGVPGLDGFTGLILSPVNRSERELRGNVAKFREKGQFDIILDPQLYCPKSERGQLPKHSYFPRDLDTADLSSDGWWKALIKKLVAEGGELKVDALCSPAVLPGKTSSEYYAKCVDIYAMLATELNAKGIRPVMTVCIALKELAEPNDALRIASIITTHALKACYIVIEADVAPRREIANAMNLFSLMVLISALEKSGCRTLVSHCSSDMILMKAAGAFGCASGKFFNLRRFTRGRFDEEQEGGGGQLPYWFEQNLVAFLRAADIARLRREGFDTFIGGGNSNNVFAGQIWEQFANDPQKPWVALSWRQYLAWFIATEKQLSTGEALPVVATWLRDAESRWRQLEKKDVLLEERQNDGEWIRAWRQAISDFRKFSS